MTRFRRFKPEPNTQFRFGSGLEILYEVQVQVQTKGGLNRTEPNFGNTTYGIHGMDGGIHPFYLDSIWNILGSVKTSFGDLD